MPPPHCSRYQVRREGLTPSHTCAAHMHSSPALPPPRNAAVSGQDLAPDCSTRWGLDRPPASSRPAPAAPLADWLASGLPICVAAWPPGPPTLRRAGNCDAAISLRWQPSPLFSWAATYQGAGTQARWGGSEAALSQFALLRRLAASPGGTYRLLLGIGLQAGAGSAGLAAARSDAAWLVSALPQLAASLPSQRRLYSGLVTPSNGSCGVAGPSQPVLSAQPASRLAASPAPSPSLLPLVAFEVTATPIADDGA